MYIGWPFLYNVLDIHSLLNSYQFPVYVVPPPSECQLYKSTSVTLFFKLELGLDSLTIKTAPLASLVNNPAIHISTQMPYPAIHHKLSINHHKENKVCLFWAKSNPFKWEALGDLTWCSCAPTYCPITPKWLGFRQSPVKDNACQIHIPSIVLISFSYRNHHLYTPSNRMYNLSWLPSLPTPLTTRSQAWLATPAPISAASSPLTSLNALPGPFPQQTHNLTLRRIPSSDSDSESFAPCPVHPTAITPVVDLLYVPAEVHQVSLSAAPILSAGHLTVHVMHQFDNACWHYFLMKDIDAANCVAKIIYNFKSSTVQSWILAEGDWLVALTFPEFLITFKKKILPHTREDDLVQDQITIQGSMNFLTWVNKVRNANNELKAAKSPYHIPKDCFWLHLLPWLSDGLKWLYKVNNGVAPGASKGSLDTITDFSDWLEHLQLLELDLQAAWGSGWVACATKAGNVLHNSSVMNTSNDTSTSTATYSGSTPLMPLTDAKKELLKLHQGCFKCWVFYVEHISCNCTNPHHYAAHMVEKSSNILHT